MNCIISINLECTPAPSEKSEETNGPISDIECWSLDVEHTIALEGAGRSEESGCTGKFAFFYG